MQFTRVAQRDILLFLHPAGARPARLSNIQTAAVLAAAAHRTRPGYDFRTYPRTRHLHFLKRRPACIAPSPSELETVSPLPGGSEARPRSRDRES